MSIWRWADLFSNTPERFRITLGEGNTPLVRSKRIGPAAGLRNLHFKLETANPTGSYKDRFAAAAIAAMLEQGQSHCVATSSGNTGSALAAYCAAADIKCEIAIVESAPVGKLSQMMIYGADIYKIRGFGLDTAITLECFTCIKDRAARPGAALQISAFAYSPVGMAGVQTISYELAQQVSASLDHVFVPAGGGGLTLAVARGFEGLVADRRLPRSPCIECVQPEGNDTIASPLRQGAVSARAVSCTSGISGLQVPSVIDGNHVIAACRATGGTGHTVSDHEVWAAQKRLALEEGIFCEPAGAAALAGALRAVSDCRISRDAQIVCLVTGSGFKDSPSIERMLEGKSCPTYSLAELRQRNS